MTTTLRAMEEASITTEDGTELPATIFQSNAGLPGNGPLVLVSSATAVPRRFYRHFAQYLADNGAHAVMIYDYRGMNGGFTRKQALEVRMADWALLDFPAAVAALQSRFPDHALCGIGHSFGGQAFGLSGTSKQFLRYMTLAAGSGYLGNMPDERRLRFFLNRVGYPVSRLLGHLPRWAGLGEPIPFGVFNQWRQWCNSPDYFISDRSLPETSRFVDVLLPMTAIGFEDDPWATRPNVEALVSWYTRADIRIRWFEPEEMNGKEVGHLGFFRPTHKDTLWPQIADWLVRE